MGTLGIYDRPAHRTTETIPHDIDTTPERNVVGELARGEVNVRFRGVGVRGGIVEDAKPGAE